MRISDWRSDVCSSDLLACLASHLGQSAPHLCFDRIQFSNASENMQGLGAALLLGNIVELASNMGPASGFCNPTTVVKGIEPGIPIGLNNALEAFKMTLGMLTFAIRRVSEPHRRRLLAGCGPVIAHIRPQPPCAGLATARCPYRTRGVVRIPLVYRKSRV